MPLLRSLPVLMRTFYKYSAQIFRAYGAAQICSQLIFHGKVMVWSAGPDKKHDTGPANDRANSDNILSWR